MRTTFTLLASLSLALASHLHAATPEEARAIAKEAYIYGYPLVDNYRVIHSYYVNTASPEYRGPFNKIASNARVYTPEDKAIQTPNSDTPYSFFALDLRTEPYVLTLIAGNGVIQQSDAGVRDPKLSERQIVNNSTEGMSLP